MNYNTIKSAVFYMKNKTKFSSFYFINFIDFAGTILYACSAIIRFEIVDLSCNLHLQRAW